MKCSVHVVGSLALLACLLVVHTSVAQLPVIGKQDKPSTEFVPDSAFMVASAFPAKIVHRPEFKLLPREIFTALGKKELGFDPMKITEVTWVLKKPDVDDPEPVFAAALHFEEMQGLAGKVIDDMKEETINGRTVYTDTENEWRPSFMVFDESTIIVGTKEFLGDLTSANGNGALPELMSKSNLNGQVSAFLDIEGSRPFIQERMNELRDELDLPPPMAELAGVPDLIDSIEASLNIADEVKMTIVARTANETDAERVEQILLDAMAYGKEEILRQMSGQLDMNDPVQAATLQYTNRMYEKYEALLAPELEGNKLTITMNEEVMTLPFLLSMFSQSVRMEGPSIRMTPEVQLRQTALAFHNYVSVYRKFPTDMTDEEGRVLMSRRVAMLPFLEQSAVFQSLKHDEPWDSAHNSQFTSMVVPAFGTSEGAMTNIRFPVYPNSIWDPENPATGFPDVRDGTSNTIFAILVPDDARVEWANPAPWRISKSDPMRDVFGKSDEVTVAMLDGSTKVLKRSEMTNRKLKAMLTYSGGESTNR